jgi:hypothetical protein
VTSSPLYAESLDDATASVRALRLVGLLSERQTDSLIAQVREFFDDALSAEAVLNHGDLWIGNAIWDGTRVVSIVDFEFAVIAPVELDLNELAKHAFGPSDTIDDEQSVLLPRRQAVVDIATRLPVRASLLTGMPFFWRRGSPGARSTNARSTTSGRWTAAGVWLQWRKKTAVTWHPC